MAMLRLFANLRELAGTDRLEIDGATVGEIVDQASERFGPVFRDGTARARVWRNGDPAEPGDPVGPTDEIALIPPVSGGSEAVGSTTPGLESLVAPVLAGALVIANVAAGASWWPAALVGVVSMWAVDLTQSSRAVRIPLSPVLASVLTAMIATHLLGAAGLGLAVGAALVIVFGIAVFVPSHRDLSTLAPTAVVGIAASAAVSSLMATRASVDLGPRAVGVYLVVVIGAGLLAAVFERFSRLPLADPIAGVAVGAVILALGAAAVWDLDLVTYLLTGIALAAALLAGRGFGSLVRTGGVSLADRPPGLLDAADGAVLAAGLLYPVLALIG
ncbi:MAG: MoaD/ThiS family protein [Acidimicrobiia bacterium]|jgi:molybdopterin converting factor small subunit